MNSYSEILKHLPEVHRRPVADVDTCRLIAKAKAMTRRGYQHCEKSLEALEKYMQGYGILLSGGVGVGKTYFFQTVNPEPIEVLSFNQCYLWKFDKLDEWLERHASQEIVLDDIGWNREEGNNYGTRFEALQVALDARLSGCQARTHITTNCTNDELIERFDAHLVDRIYQCCSCFVFPQRESFREARPNEIYLRNQEYNIKYRGDEGL